MLFFNKQQERAGPVAVNEEQEGTMMTSDVEMLEDDMFGDVVAGGGEDQASSSTSPFTAEVHTGPETLEIERLKTLLAQKEAKLALQSEKISRLEGELVSEIELSGDMTLEMVNLQELADERGDQIQQLTKALRKERIQNHLRTAADKMMMLVSPQRQKQLVTQEEKVSHLFADVLKILIPMERKRKNLVNWRDLLPTLLACRLVCKSWKESVELILQQDSSHTDLCDKQNYSPSPRRICYYNLDYSKRIHDLQNIWLQKKSDPNYNPIPSRHLFICADPCNDFDSEKWIDFCRFVKGYLQLVGQQVWYLTVLFIAGGGGNDRFRTCMVGCKCLSEWFSLVPNLRSLSLSTFFTNGMQENWLQELEKIPFPKFRDLVTFQGLFEPDCHLYGAVLKNNRHVKHLELSTCSNLDHRLGSPRFMEIDFPGLSSFKCTFEHIEDWEKFVQVPWKLEDLSVDFYSCARPTWQQFSEGVEKFGNTLKSLTFNLSVIGSGYHGELKKLNLPHLKSLQLVSKSWDWESLDSILAPLENLETFSLELAALPLRSKRQLEHAIESEKKAFLDYLSNFRDKTDWMKLAKLRSVKVTANLKGWGGCDDRNAFVMTRVGLPLVRFDVVIVYNNLSVIIEKPANL